MLPSRRTSNPYRHIKREKGKRSGLETEIGAQLDMDDPDHKSEKEIEFIEYKNELVKKYHPDFQLTNGILIEAKGWWKREDRTKHLCIKFQHPELDIRFVFSNPNTKIAKNSKTTYGLWCTRNGFKFAKGTVPESWTKEPRQITS